MRETEFRSAIRAIEWITSLNESEAGFWERTGNYGDLPELQISPPPQQYSTTFIVEGTQHYTLKLKPRNLWIPGYYTDETKVIRRCPGSVEPAVTCPAMGGDETLIAQGRNRQIEGQGGEGVF